MVVCMQVTRWFSFVSVLYMAGNSSCGVFAATFGLYTVFETSVGTVSTQPHVRCFVPYATWLLVVRLLTCPVLFSGCHACLNLST